MEAINKITQVGTAILNLLGLLLGIGIFAELLFGQFLGNFSVIGNLINIVSQFGDAGFPGLIALLLILHFAGKK
jgi:hypothetical protein